MIQTYTYTLIYLWWIGTFPEKQGSAVCSQHQSLVVFRLRSPSLQYDSVCISSSLDMVLWRAKTSSSAVNKLSRSAARCRGESRAGLINKLINLDVTPEDQGNTLPFPSDWEHILLWFTERNGFYPAEAQVVQQLAVQLILPSSEDKQLVNRRRCQQHDSHLGEERTSGVNIANHLCVLKRNYRYPMKSMSDTMLRILPKDGPSCHKSCRWGWWSASPGPSSKASA